MGISRFATVLGSYPEYLILTTLGRLRQIPRYGMWSELRILPPGTLPFVRYQINMNTIASSNNFNLLPFYVGQL